MTLSDPHLMTASDIAGLTRSGELTAEAVARSCLERIDQRDAEVLAWAYLDPDRVIAEARRLDASDFRGPLHGVPIGVKDVILTKDMPTQYNSPIYTDDFPRVDAACVQTLRAAGALIFGKTVTTEFAASVVGGKTRNPHDPARTPGGSSSGSGAAVADFQVPLGIGTQTGGSTLRPASFNGVLALKPTWNAINREGLKMFVISADTLGLYARSVADLELLADVFRLEDARPVEVGSRPLRIGVYRGPAWSTAEPATQDALALGVSLLESTGARIEEMVLPPEFERILEHTAAISAGEGRVAFLHEAEMHPDLLRDGFMAMVDERNTVTRAALLEAYDAMAVLRHRFDTEAARYDAVLTPSAPGEAPLGLESTGSASFNTMWTGLHAPAINIPGFVGPAGMPVGLSLVAGRYSDRRLLQVASVVADLFAEKGSWAALPIA
jgi:Asp-tRNA(Asn)/Glu-tRNA(Gln) amidotransferase A subunit family amidase